jgi:hypothetical protein
LKLTSAANDSGLAAPPEKAVDVRHAEHRDVLRRNAPPTLAQRLSMDERVHLLACPGVAVFPVPI